MQNSYLQLLLNEAEETIAEVNRLCVPLSAAQLNWKPNTDVWSVAQVLDHMRITNTAYHPQLEKRVADAPRTPHPSVYKSTWTGRWLISTLTPNPKRGMTTPPVFRPAQSNYAPQVLDEFNRAMAHFRNLLVRMDGADLNRARLVSPALFLIRINAGDYFKMETNHLARHRNQIKRLLAHEKFPHL
jgi:hypothetical protein